MYLFVYPSHMGHCLNGTSVFDLFRGECHTHNQDTSSQQSSSPEYGGSRTFAYVLVVLQWFLRQGVTESPTECANTWCTAGVNLKFGQRLTYVKDVAFTCTKLFQNISVDFPPDYRNVCDTHICDLLLFYRSHGVCVYALSIIYHCHAPTQAQTFSK